jgi:hypothetical protein
MAFEIIDKIYFIVGRGYHNVVGNTNLKMNSSFEELSDVLYYVDRDVSSAPDFNCSYSEIDYEELSFNGQQLEFYFDYSTFTCSIDEIYHLYQKLDNIVINIPLEIDESSFSSEIKKLPKYAFTVKKINGKYPLFDWTDKKTFEYINPTSYIQIIF